MRLCSLIPGPAKLFVACSTRSFLQWKAAHGPGNEASDFTCPKFACEVWIYSSHILLRSLLFSLANLERNCQVLNLHKQYSISMMSH